MNFKLKTIIRLNFLKIKWLLYNIFSPKIYVSINKKRILAPRFHKLQLFMDINPCYDRFLNYLVRNLDDYDFVDVGANIGDTATHLYTSYNPPLNSILIEPNLKFRNYLNLNLKTISSNSDANINVIDLPVSSLENIPELSTNSTTSKQKKSAKLIKAISLDKVLNDYNYSHNKLLIKIDIEGYDWDAILSAREIIKIKKPLLFFECVILNKLQLYGYFSILEILTKNYKNILILDNFGNPYFDGKLDVDILKNSFLKCFSASKIKNPEYFYFDIFVYNDGDKEIVNKAIKDVLNIIN